MNYRVDENGAIIFKSPKKTTKDNDIEKLQTETVNLKKDTEVLKGEVAILKIEIDKLRIK